ncbi:Ribosomal protein L33 family protein [Striga hermonthica]|uniref:Ribosomal protein L33 family protein n=1 Tax=Striga hermonthica TaxID=68872 RepID=A0A9N7N2H1_STRHE|nr:Ribosomal protein L33 family protein [Striga hermonthica]
MGEKKKAGAMLVRLVSAAGTGFFYVVKKTKRLQSNNIKLEFRNPSGLRGARSRPTPGPLVLPRLLGFEIGLSICLEPLASFEGL